MVRIVQCKMIKNILNQQLGRPHNGLEKVCFAPLVSKFSGPPKVSDCVVQSVWGYFGNKPYKLDRTSRNPDRSISNYLDSLKICFRYVPNYISI